MRIGYRNFMDGMALNLVGYYPRMPRMDLCDLLRHSVYVIFVKKG